MAHLNLVRWLLKVALLVIVVDILIVTCGCASGQPEPTDEIRFSQPSQTVTHELTATPEPTPRDCGPDGINCPPEGAVEPDDSKCTIGCEFKPPIVLEPAITMAPKPSVPWPTLLDGEVTFRAEDTLMAPNGEVVAWADWIEETIEEGWQIDATHIGLDFQADLQIAIHDDLMYNGRRVCGLASNSAGKCYVTLSYWCWEQDFIYDGVPEKTLLHEVGHCMGLPHRDQGVMATPVQYWTTEEDIEEIHTTYGLR